MARKRTIDPGIWTSDQFTSIKSPWARLLFIGIISNADDEGRMVANPRHLRAVVFPGDGHKEDRMGQWRDILAANGLINVYKCPASAQILDATEYLFLPNWTKYQHISKRYPSLIPEPPFHNHSVTTPEPVDNHSIPIGNGVGNGVGVEDGDGGGELPAAVVHKGACIFCGFTDSSENVKGYPLAQECPACKSGIFRWD